MNNNELFLSVTDVNTYIKTVLEKDSFLSYVSVKGEISNLKVHSRGHLYFSIKDEESKINVVMFNYKNYNLDFEPKDGMQVLIKGKVSVFVSGGNYQITAVSMKQDGVGQLYILFEELKKKLAKEGLFDADKKLKLPRMPKKIGVITAPTGAAVKDIISTINRRFPLCEITVFPTLVQGDGAKENICRMLEMAYKSDVDVIILGRGGGSIEDLWAFNEEMVARKIAQRNKPIVSAVGHEIDFTISDFVSDLRAPTPTGAAELVVPSKDEILKYLKDYKGRIISVLNNKINKEKEIIEKIKQKEIMTNPKSMFNKYEQKLDVAIDKLSYTLPNRIEKEKTSLNNLIDKLINNKNIYLERKRNTLDKYKLKIDLLNPDNLLDKGYSITLVNGKIIKDIKDVKESDIITTKIKNGVLTSIVKEVK